MYDRNSAYNRKSSNCWFNQSGSDENQVKEYLDELEFLADTAGAVVLKRFTQKLDIPNTATFVGPGKLEEISNYIKVEEADTIIFDDELSPTQLRNLERTLECKVLDRTNLILDIFAKRAQTLTRKHKLSWHNTSTCFRD